MKNHGIVFLSFCWNPEFCSLYGHIVCHEAIFEGPLASSSVCLSISCIRSPLWDKYHSHCSTAFVSDMCAVSCCLISLNE